MHNAIHVWEFAKSHGGRVILRIEDHDRQRAHSEFEASIREDLTWLGFEPDEEAPRQSERGAVYRAVVDELAAKGAHVRVLLHPAGDRRHGLGRDR